MIQIRGEELKSRWKISDMKLGMENLGGIDY